MAALLCISPSASAAVPTRLETLRFRDSNPAPSPVTGFRAYVESAGVWTVVELGRPAPGADGIRAFPLVVASGATVHVELTAYNANGESGHSNRIQRAPRRPAFDHNADGGSDLVRSDDASGLVEILPDASDANAQVLSLAAPPHAAIVARGDFDGSGTADLVWQSRGTRELALWSLGGAGASAPLATAAVTVSNPANAGPVAAWAFEEGSGKSVADASGNGNQGALVGPSWTSSGRFGKALSFTGTARVEVPDSATLALSTGMTLEAWVYPTQALTRWSALIQKEADAYLLHTSSPGDGVPVAGATVGGESCCAWALARSTLPVNTWTHLAATYDGARIALHVNGVEAAASWATGAIQRTGAILRIGNSPYANQAFAGRIDEVRIYDRALDSAEILADMATPVVASTGSSASAAPLRVSLLAAPGAPLSGVVTLELPIAGAVAGGVQFLLDGAPLGPPDTAAPYETTWDTQQASDGAHTLSAQRVGGTQTQAVSTALATPAPPLRLLGSGDLDADARDDLVFRDAVSGELELWLMDGATRRQQARIPGPGAPWRLVGIADVDADRRSDLVWWDAASGALRIWQMNGATVLEELQPTNPLPQGAQPIGLGDEDGDGSSDLVARLGFQYWIGAASLRDGLGPLSVIATVDPQLGAATGHDFDGDGSADLLLVSPSARSVNPLLLGPSGGSNPPLDFSAGSLSVDIARQIGDRDADWEPDWCDVDFDNDGVVGQQDYQLLSLCLGDPALEGCEAADSDGDGDGALGLPELLLIGSTFGGPVCQ